MGKFLSALLVLVVCLVADSVQACSDVQALVVQDAGIFGRRVVVRQPLFRPRAAIVVGRQQAIILPQAIVSPYFVPQQQIIIPSQPQQLLIVPR